MWGAADGGFLYLKHNDFIDLSCISPTPTHMSPPLGLWSWLGRACYRHAAPLGLCWFISLEVHWFIELMNPVH